METDRSRGAPGSPNTSGRNPPSLSSPPHVRGYMAEQPSSRAHHPTVAAAATRSLRPGRDIQRRFDVRQDGGDYREAPSAVVSEHQEAPWLPTTAATGTTESPGINKAQAALVCQSLADISGQLRVLSE
eukprot:GHVU01080886.1.p2 GENE.GHVU01080886.1~~GHVU01080886.1.p2  ORF type:complete len:129 (-),score=5.29 GHVU01080886.1:595-981(-)